MKPKSTQRIKLGIFVSLGLIFFAVAVFFMGNSQNIFGRFFRLHANFQQVSGLRLGNNVRLMGVTIGTVQSIEIISDTSIQVSMLIEDEMRRFIRTDAVAKVGSDGLVGDRVVNIKPSSSQSPIVEPGGTILSQEATATDVLLRKLEGTQSDVEVLIENLIGISAQVYQGKGTIGQLLNDTLMAADMRNTLINLNRASQGSLELMAQFQESVRLIQEGQGIITNLLTDSTWVQHMDSTLENLDVASQRLEETVVAFEGFVEEMQSSAGPLGTMMRDTAVSDDLKAIMENLDTGTERFSENMKALQQNFLFRKFFKKKAKEEAKMKKGNSTSPNPI